MDQLSRRQFTITAAATCACVAFSGASALAAPAGPVDVGSAADYKQDGANAQWARSHGFIVIRREKRIYAVSALCTHSNKAVLNPGDPGLRCPKHGSQFDLAGAVVKGPARRPLARFAIRAEKGKLIVDPSQRFEENQWDNAAAFVAVD